MLCLSPVAETSSEIRIDDKDFSAVFANGKWIVSCEWKDVESEPVLKNIVSQYSMAERVQKPFENISTGMDLEWLA